MCVFLYKWLISQGVSWVACMHVTIIKLIIIIIVIIIIASAFIMQPRKAWAWEQGYNSYTCRNHATTYTRVWEVFVAEHNLYTMWMIKSCKPMTTKLKYFPNSSICGCMIPTCIGVIALLPWPCISRLHEECRGYIGGGILLLSAKVISSEILCKSLETASKPHVHIQ